MAALIARHSELSLHQTPSGPSTPLSSSPDTRVVRDVSRPTQEDIRDLVRDVSRPTEDNIRELVMTREGLLRSSQNFLRQEDAPLVPPRPLPARVASPPLSPRVSVSMMHDTTSAEPHDEYPFDPLPANRNVEATLETTGVLIVKATQEPVLQVRASLQEDGEPGRHTKAVLADFLKNTASLIQARMPAIPRRISSPSTFQDSVSCATAFGEAPESPSTGCVATKGPHGKQTIFLIDWDDTLFPSTEWHRCSSVNGEEVNLGPAMRVHIDELQDIIIKLLKKAEMHGTVCLITNATSGWMQHSLWCVMPRVHAYLNGAGISFISARRTYFNRFPDQPFKWKAMAFLAQLRVLKGKTKVNVVVLGDTTEDLHAGHFAAQQIDKAEIKVIKLKEAPTVEQLKNELRFITDHLATVAHHQGSLNLSLEA